MNPEDLAKSGTEVGHQAALFCWAALPDIRRLYPAVEWLYGGAEGGYRDKITGGRLKAQGIKSGVPDLRLPSASRGYHGLYIELKKDYKAYDVWVRDVDNHQHKWIAYLNSAGYYACCCVGWEQARNCIIWYLNGEK